ncbi:hypothetical protein OHA74_54300 [Streptomyces phaeochromogenes]|uniref:hypothetical protein n=1 Tax=Streptomyces phaeochromogenes TaxID=1923 RepID=UPI002E27D66E|nr:hypothetical protein [Streptomyces phaeochromogenes]
MAGFWANIRMMARVMVWVVGALLFVIILVAVVFVPSLLLGWAVGLSITVVLLGFGVCIAQKIFDARLGPGERRRKERRWLRGLYSLELIGPPKPDRDYREAFESLWFFGWAGGWLAGAEAIIIVGRDSSNLPASAVIWSLVFVLIICPLMGVVAVVLYMVHLHYWVGGWVWAWRQRRLRRLLERSAKRPTSTLGLTIADPSWDVELFADVVDLGGGADSDGAAGD